MRATDVPLLVQHKPRRPGFHSVSLPRRVIIIGNNWILDAERRHFTPNVFNVSFAIEFGCVYANDRQSLVAIARVPTLDRRQGVTAVIAPERPELDHHY